MLPSNCRWELVMAKLLPTNTSDESPTLFGIAKLRYRLDSSVEAILDGFRVV
jgi:hypothetical protein